MDSPPEVDSLVSLRHNLSSLDRIVRLLLGASALALSLGGWVSGHAALALFLFAWVPIVTGLAGWCPIYVMFGISSCRH